MKLLKLTLHIQIKIYYTYLISGLWVSFLKSYSASNGYSNSIHLKHKKALSKQIKYATISMVVKVFEI